MSQRPNILLIMSDEHDPAVTGCYGHLNIETPHLDRLASEGTTFDNAYTACPICVPARMSFMTGQYVHQIGTWDNGSPLASSIPTMGSYLEAAGYETAICGRHFVGPERLHGFGTRLMDDAEKWKHWNMSAPSRTPDARRASNSHVTECGPGENWQNDYDRTAADLSERFLKSRAQYADRPFLLYTGFMNPHFPLLCPREYFDRYYPDRVVLPHTRTEPCETQHPSIQQLRYWLRNEEPLDDAISTTATAAYYGLISFTDHLIGRLLNIVDNSSLRDNTVVIYVSDHGEMGGPRYMAKAMLLRTRRARPHDHSPSEYRGQPAHRRRCQPHRHPPHPYRPRQETPRHCPAAASYPPLAVTPSPTAPFLANTTPSAL